jgi:cob(I)alamin adenosyltransferase
VTDRFDIQVHLVDPDFRQDDKKKEKSVSPRSLIIIYIGFGKGKTTAAVGLAVRAAGAGKKVLFCQLVKTRKARQSGEWPQSSEISVLKKIKGITVKVLGKGFVGILGDTKKRVLHLKAARSALLWLRKQMRSQKFEVIIADELISALELRLVKLIDIKKLIKLARQKKITLALTGHNKYNDLIKQADLVTEMKMIKHPYYQGRLGEKGIDF